MTRGITWHRRRILLAAIALIAAALSAGCASSDGPGMLVIAPADYSAAFDAALEAARREGLPAEFRDRRGGVIDTAPEFAGSIIEPWRTDNANVDQALANTVNFQRRRARFEFTPAGMTSAASEAAPPATEVGDGPPLVASAERAIDLTQTDQPLELRVSVFVERAQTPGRRRSTWSREASSSYIILPTEPDGERLPGQYWTPVTRDPATERRLLASVSWMLHRQYGIAP